MSIKVLLQAANTCPVAPLSREILTALDEGNITSTVFYMRNSTDGGRIKHNRISLRQRAVQ